MGKDQKKFNLKKQQTNKQTNKQTYRQTDIYVQKKLEYISSILALCLCSDEGLTLKMTANTLFTVFSICTSTLCRYIVCFLKLTCSARASWEKSPFSDVRADKFPRAFRTFSKIFCHFYVWDSIFSGLFPSYDKTYLRPLKYPFKSTAVFNENMFISVTVYM